MALERTGYRPETFASRLSRVPQLGDQVAGGRVKFSAALRSFWEAFQEILDRIMSGCIPAAFDLDDNEHDADELIKLDLW